MHETYENPLVTRYASSEMAALFSDKHRVTLWRKLWIALAEGEKQLGLNITDKQIAEMKKYAGDINFDTAEMREREVRHDVMAHVYAFGMQATSAMPIIHLGATSCFVTDNADMLIYRDALALIRTKLAAVIRRIRDFALKYKDMPTLGFTHFQPAQLTTVGKRAALWLQDLAMDYHNLKHLAGTLKLRGVRGATGTQASFLSLLEGDHEKVKALEKFIVAAMGMEACYGVTGQTYPRKADYNIISVLSQIAQSAYKFAEDLRLLQHLKEIEEPFESAQIGSSAMAYKRNPMRSERICSLARFVISLPINEAMTASTQWFERTLDDSANRRLTMPQAFLAADAILNLYLNISEGLVVNPKIIEKRVREELPFMATEDILMECVKYGGDRQQLHELLRRHSMESARRVKEDGLDNDLIARIKADSAFRAIRNNIDALMSAEHFTGRAAKQTEEFVKAEIDPLLQGENDTVKTVKADVKV